jgi:CRP/FNR family transcriptional regulator
MLPPEITEELDEFFHQYTHLFFKRKEMILRSDDARSNVYYITNGYVRAYRISEDGEELTLLILKPGDFFPMTYGLNNFPNIYYLEALTPLEVWRAPQKKFLAFLKSSPEIFYELSTRVMDRFDGLLARMEYIIWSKAYTKIAATLLLCARSFGEKSGTDIIVQVPLTHKDIANLVGLTRETTSIEMKKLEKKGLVRRKGKLLIVKDMKQLEQESVLNHQGELLNNSFI